MRKWHRSNYLVYPIFYTYIVNRSRSSWKNGIYNGTISTFAFSSSIRTNTTYMLFTFHTVRIVAYVLVTLITLSIVFATVKSKTSLTLFFLFFFVTNETFIIFILCGILTSLASFSGITKRAFYTLWTKFITT